MRKEYPKLIAQALLRILIGSNTLPSFMIILEYTLECLLYLLVLHTPEIIQDIFVFNKSTLLYLLLVCLGLLTARIFIGISFIKVFCPVILYLLITNIHQHTLVSAFFLTLLLLLIVIDVLSNIKLNFTSQSMAAETINSNKIVHALLFTFGIIQAQILNNLFSIIICGVGFAFLTILKGASSTQNDNLKQVLMRIYLLLSMDHFMMVVSLFVSLPTALTFAAPIILSQFIYQVYSLKKSTPKLQELFSQEKYFQLSFKICKFINGRTSNRSFEQQIQIFIGQGSFASLTEQYKRHAIYQKLIVLLSRNKSFQNELLLAIIQIISSHRLLKARYLTESLKKHSDYNLIKKILIYRIQELIEKHYSFENKKVTFEFYENSLMCDDFRTLLLKAATHYINFWQYTRKPEILPEKLREMSDKLIHYEQKVKRQYENNEHNCITISILYISYLFEVARDPKEARKILEFLSFNEENLDNFEINERIFVKFGLEEEPLKILKVSYNVSLLLGYERKELEGQQYEVFLPEFYHKSHRNILNRTFDDQFDTLHLINRKTIVKNKWNYYEECNVVFKLHYQFGQALFLQGFLNIKNNPQYIWTDFLFINDNEDIIECSDSLSAVAPTPSQLHKMDEFFPGEPNLNKSNFHEDREYYPLLVFNLQADVVTYFVRRQSKRFEVEEVSNEKLVHLLNSIKHVTLDSTFVKKYYETSKQAINNIFSKEYPLLAVVSLVLIVGIFVSEMLFYNTMTFKQISQNNMINRTSDIIHYANNYTEIGIYMNYFDMNSQFSYSNNFTNITNMLPDTLKLQALNERLKDLSVEKYPIPSVSLPGVSYNMSSYQITLEYLTSAYMLEQFKKDPYILKLTLQNLRLKQIAMSKYTTTRIRDSYINYIDGLPSSNISDSVVLIVVITIMITILVVIVIRCEYKSRINEQEALALVCNTKDQEELIDSTKIFISKITKEEIKIIRSEFPLDTTLKNTKKPETSFSPELSGTDRENMKSEASMRELSNRNLMEESLNKSLYAQSKPSKLKEEKPSLPLHSTEIKLTSRKKRYILVPILILLLILGMLILNLVKNGVIYGLNELTSAQNIFGLFTQTLNLSKRANSFFIYINLKAAGYAVKKTDYNAKQSDFDRIQNSITFQQVKLKEFAQLQDKIIKLQYYYLCNFIECDSRFANEINIIYTSTIYKMFTYINQIMDRLDPLNSSAATTELSSSSTKYLVDLIYYSEMVIRKELTEILDTYDECYLNYSQSLISTKQRQITIVIVFTAVGSLLLLIFGLVLLSNQRKLKRIVNIFKTNYDMQQLQEQQGIKSQDNK